MKPMSVFILLLWTGATCLSGQTGSLYVKAQVDTLRSAPLGPVIGLLAGGTRVDVLEKRPDWVKVQVAVWMPESSLTVDSTRIAGFSIRVSHILVVTEEEASQVLRDLKGGLRFEDIAASRSKDAVSAARGGDMGEFQRGDLLPALENAAFSLKPGQTGGPVRTALGFHIIQRTR
jgi:hypothetical protein